jgi:hypothetical protein
MNKKGAEMTIGTIVVIILALVVLVVLIYGFSTGWGNLWENIIGFGGGKVNVQNVVDSCKVACATSGTYDFCRKPRDVTFEGTPTGESKSGLVSVSVTCDKLMRGGDVPTVKPAAKTVSLPTATGLACDLSCA